MAPDRIAEICHEVNRTLCAAYGDYSQVPWPEAPDWQKQSAVNGVHFHLANPYAGASASHENWMAEKTADGWVWGPVKNPETKQHPCMTPYEKLPIEQQLKDHLFKTIVSVLSKA
jgi:hypothetical protein